MDQQGTSSPWTAERIEVRLIAAFRALPSSPVYSRAGRVRANDRAGGSHAEALSWAARFAPGRNEALALLTWARCRATGESDTSKNR